MQLYLDARYSAPQMVRWRDQASCLRPRSLPREPSWCLRASAKCARWVWASSA